MELLVVEDVRKSYGETVALAGVSLEVEEGEVFGLLGPNGAGKTSLIRVVMDIVRADSGTIRLFGAPRTADSLDRVSYLPEERGLYTKRKVLDVMAYFGALKGLSRREARARSRRWLARVGLEHTAHWNVERLSKGMSQKVQIASTLLVDPPLVVLDEPFSGLDPVNVRLVRELIQERRDNGRTTVLSTHQMNEVEALCNRVALIHRGRRVVYGPVEDVRREHSAPEVLVVTDGPLPPLDRAREIAGSGEGPRRLELRPGVEPWEVLQELVEKGVRVEAFERRLAPMEDIFVRVVGGTPGEELEEVPA